MRCKKNKSVHSCQFVHHAKIYCLMAALNKLFKFEFERGELKKSPNLTRLLVSGRSPECPTAF